MVIWGLALMRGVMPGPSIDVMDNNYVPRSLVWAAVAAGATDIIIASLDLLASHRVLDNAQPAPLGYVEQATVVVGDLCFLLAWLGVGAAYRAAGRWGRSGRAAIALALVSGLLVLLANVVTLVAWRQQLVPLHLVGFVLWLAASVTLLVAGWRCGPVPRWLLVAFAICPIVVWAGPLGQYAYGAVWMLVGVVLLRAGRPGIVQRETPARTV